MVSDSRQEQLRCRQHPRAQLTDDYGSADVICPECGLVVAEPIIDVATYKMSLLTSDCGSVHYQKKSIEAFKEISVMAHRMNLAETIEDAAKDLFKLIYCDKQIARGRHVNCVASVCLYIACRKKGVARTLKEICDSSKASDSDIKRCFNQISKSGVTSLDPVAAQEFIPRFCSHLALPLSVQDAACHIAEMAVQLGVVAGRAPGTLAAAAVYMASRASGCENNPKKISRVSGISERTIHKTCRMMYPRAKSLFPAGFHFVVPSEYSY